MSTARSIPVSSTPTDELAGESHPITHRAAVVGQPVAHSLSPVLHQAGYDELGLTGWDYSRIECDAASLPALVAGAPLEFVGFSVTMPGKFAALNLADEVTERARSIGAANTLVRLDDAAGWRADNTDVEGIHGALKELLGESPSPRQVLIIGAGGTARTAAYVVSSLGAREITILNRSERTAELSDVTGTAHLQGYSFDADLTALSERADAIISTVPAAALKGHERELAHAPVLDVIYDPRPTPLCLQAASNGFLTVGGHVMLAHQAFGQFEQFTGKTAPKKAMRKALEAALDEVVTL